MFVFKTNIDLNHEMFCTFGLDLLISDEV